MQTLPPGVQVVLSGGSVDLRTGRVHGDGGVTLLTTKERELLVYLVGNAGRDLARHELLTDVWGYAATARSRAVDHTVTRLRKKIEANPREPVHLLTVFGHGYRFEMPARAAPVPGIVGRHDELARLEAAWAAGALVTVVGPPGVGKTCLARAHLAQTPLPGTLCDLAEARTSAAAARRISAALGIAMGGDRSDAEELDRIAHVLAGGGPRVLVLDNLEQAIDAMVPVVEALHRGAAGVRVLCTSRIPLRIAAEQVIELAPLPPDDAVALFVERAAGASDDAVPALVERLDRLPLAIEIAAARTRAFAPAEILRRLGAPHRLRARRRDRPERHASLEHALRWSWDLLDPGERELFAQCAVFRGTFTVADAEAVLDGADVPGTLLELVDHSLLVSRGRDGLHLLQAVRAFAGDRLAAGHAVHRRHAAWFGDRAAAWLAPIRRGERVAVAAALTASADLRHVGRGRGAHALAAAEAVHALSLNREPVAAHLAQAEAVLACQGSAPDRARALRMVAASHYCGGDVERCLAACAEGLAAAAPDSATAAELGFIQAVAFHRAGRLDRAEAGYSRWRVRFAALGDGPRVAGIDVNLGIVLAARGDRSAACERYVTGIRRARQAGDRVTAMRGLISLANSQGLLGRLREAERSYQEAAALAEALGDRRNAACIASNRARLAVQLGDLVTAEGLGAGAVGMARELGDRVLEGEGLGRQAMVALALGRPEEAIALRHEGRDRLDGLANPDHEAVFHTGVGLARHTLGQLDRAADHYRRAVETTASARRRGVAQGLLAMALAGLGRASAAAASLGEARRLLGDAPSVAVYAAGAHAWSTGEPVPGPVLALADTHRHDIDVREALDLLRRLGPRTPGTHAWADASR